MLSRTVRKPEHRVPDSTGPNRSVTHRGPPAASVGGPLRHQKAGPFSVPVSTLRSRAPNFLPRGAPWQRRRVVESGLRGLRDRDDGLLPRDVDRGAGREGPTVGRELLRGPVRREQNSHSGRHDAGSVGGAGSQRVEPRQRRAPGTRWRNTPQPLHRRRDAVEAMPTPNASSTGKTSATLPRSGDQRSKAQ